RIEAMRQVTRKLLKLDQADMADKLGRLVGDGPVSPAVAGLELLRAGHKDQAGKLAALVLGFYPAPPKEKEKPDAPKQTLPALTPDIVALVTAAGLKLPPATEPGQKDV